MYLSTAAWQVTLVDPVTLPLVAVIADEPLTVAVALQVRRPVGDTVATLGTLEHRRQAGDRGRSSGGAGCGGARGRDRRRSADAHAGTTTHQAGRHRRDIRRTGDPGGRGREIPGGCVGVSARGGKLRGASGANLRRRY